jgi:hypothetical protein
MILACAVLNRILSATQTLAAGKINIPMLTSGPEGTGMSMSAAAKRKRKSKLKYKYAEDSQSLQTVHLQRAVL